MTGSTGTDRHKLPRKPLSVDDDLWRPFGRAVGDRRRSEVLRQFIRWYLREPGARLPERPPVERRTPRQRSAA